MPETGFNSNIAFEDEEVQIGVIKTFIEDGKGWAKGDRLMLTFTRKRFLSFKLRQTKSVEISPCYYVPGFTSSSQEWWISWPSWVSRD